MDVPCDRTHRKNTQPIYEAPLPAFRTTSTTTTFEQPPPTPPGKAPPADRIIASSPPKLPVSSSSLAVPPLPPSSSSSLSPTATATTTWSHNAALSASPSDDPTATATATTTTTTTTARIGHHRRAQRAQRPKRIRSQPPPLSLPATVVDNSTATTTQPAVASDAAAIDVVAVADEPAARHPIAHVVVSRLAHLIKFNRCGRSAPLAATHSSHHPTTTLRQHKHAQPQTTSTPPPIIALQHNHNDDDDDDDDDHHQPHQNPAHPPNNHTTTTTAYQRHQHIPQHDRQHHRHQPPRRHEVAVDDNNDDAGNYQDDDDAANNVTFAGRMTSKNIAAIQHQQQQRHSVFRQSLFLYVAASVLLAVFSLSPAMTAASMLASDGVVDVPHPIFAEGKSDKEILDHLLKAARYDKRLLPPVDDADFCCGMDTPDKAKNISGWAPGRAQNRGTLTVNVSVLLLSLASPDESSLKYEVEFLLQQQWYDPRLRYHNHSQYEYLNAIHHHENIWLPDTYFIMHGDFKEPIVPMHFALRIYRNGTINYLMRRHLILSCQGRLNIFPFDDPLCSFAMESISYEQSAITYVWKNDEDTLRKSPSLTTLNAYLIQNATTACPIKASWRADAQQTMSEEDEDFVCSLCQRRFEGNYSCLKVDLIFTRDRAFYFTTVFIPGIILVTSSFITFWLEWNAVPARSMIGNYSCLKVDLMFTRDRAFYFTTVFIPGIILVTSSFITFWLEWNAVPARVMIGVTTMLNFFTTSNGFRSTLPVVSNLTAMNVWDGVCMCFIYASLLEFVCVNYVGRKRPLHNVVYRPGENPVTQRLPAVLSRIGIILASPLEIIENEFHAALSSAERTAPSSPQSPAPQPSLHPPPPPPALPSSTVASTSGPGTDAGAFTNAILAQLYEEQQQRDQLLRQRRRLPSAPPPTDNDYEDVEMGQTTSTEQQQALRSSAVRPSRPPRRKRSRSTGDYESVSIGGPPDDGHPVLTEQQQQQQQQPMPSGVVVMVDGDGGVKTIPEITMATAPPASGAAASAAQSLQLKSSVVGGELVNDRIEAIQMCPLDKRDAAGPNEIVACTSCGGGNSPCTHSVNNGCATEVRKKEPPHPIRVAKTIDVIARITFPTAYAIFLIFFFIHYKGFS